MDVVRATKQVFTLTEKGTIHAGDVFLADRRLGGWMIIDGKFNGYFLHEHEAELVPEFEQMKKEVTELKKRYDQAIQERKLLQQEIDELTKERKELLERIKRTADEQKVALPEKVAKAIQRFRSYTGKEYWQYHLLKRVFDETLFSEDLDTIRRYIKESLGGHFLVLLGALAYGYTPKSLEEQVSDMLHEWLETGYEGDEESDRRAFAKRLTEFIKGELVQSG